MNSKTRRALSEVAHAIDMAMTAEVEYREQQCLYRAMLAGSLLASKGIKGSMPVIGGYAVQYGPNREDILATGIKDEWRDALPTVDVDMSRSWFHVVNFIEIGKKEYFYDSGLINLKNEAKALCDKDGTPFRYTEGLFPNGYTLQGRRINTRPRPGMYVFVPDDNAQEHLSKMIHGVLLEKEHDMFVRLQAAAAVVLNDGQIVTDNKVLTR